MTVLHQLHRVIDCNRNIQLPHQWTLWTFLSQSDAIHIDFVAQHLDKPWDWSSLSLHVPLPDIMANLHMPWDWDLVLGNETLTIKDIRRIQTFHQLRDSDFWDISSSNGITFPDILANPDIPWDFETVSCNQNVTIEQVLHYNKLGWIWNNLSRCAKITNFDYTLPWDWKTLSLNPTITVNDVIRFHYKPWDWASLSRHPNICLQDMLRHLELPWRWDRIDQNPNITMDDILEHPNIPWNWSNVSQYANISVDNVLRYPDIPWQYDHLSKNTNLSLDDIVDHLDKPWCIEHLMQNPFLKYQRALALTHARRHMAAFRIQTAWRRNSTHPSTNLCQRVQTRKINNHI